ncbi:MAG: response regulator [Terriglobia bacterium]
MPRTVLVADDNLTIQRMASEMLRGEDVEVITVANGMAAIKKLPEAKPLVVLADVDMPGKDGYEVCDFVKSTPELHYVRVLLAVSDADPYDQERGARVRADGIVKKPFERDQLVSMVAECLNQAETLRPPPVEPQPVPVETRAPAARAQSRPLTDRASGTAADEPYPSGPECADETIFGTSTDAAQYGAGLDLETAGELSQFSVDAISLEPSGSVQAGEAAISEYSWADPKMSTATGLPGPKGEPGSELAPPAPTGVFESSVSDMAWAPPGDEGADAVARGRSGPERQADSSVSQADEAPAGGFDIFAAAPPDAGHAKEPVFRSPGEPPCEQTVELLDASRPAEAGPAGEGQNDNPVSAPAEAGSEPFLCPGDSIEWAELDQAAKGAAPLEPGVVAEIVRKVVAMMAPPALSENALQELETRITADLLSDQP